MSGIITKVSGPLVVAEGLADANVSDVVRVGSQRLIGEILNMTGDSASIQVYEETSGLGPGAEVVTTGLPLSVELGPGMLENIYDGIQRPLPEIRALTGETITRGVQVAALNRQKKWDFVPVAQPGQHVAAGDVLGTVQETSAILHKIMVPPGSAGRSSPSKRASSPWTTSSPSSRTTTARPVSSPWCRTGRSVSPGPTARNTPPPGP